MSLKQPRLEGRLEISRDFPAIPSAGMLRVCPQQEQGGKKLSADAGYAQEIWGLPVTAKPGWVSPCCLSRAVLFTRLLHWAGCILASLSPLAKQEQI